MAENYLETMYQIYWTGFGLVWFSLVWWHINHCELFNAKPILYILTVLFRKIQFSIITYF